MTRITKKNPLEEFYGSISEGMAKEIENNIAEARARHRKLHSTRISKLKK